VKIKTTLVVAAAAALLSAPVTGWGQQRGRVPTVGVLLTTSLSQTPDALGFRSGLREHG